MFKFGFSGEENEDKEVEEDPIEWLKCSEITLERIRSLSSMNEISATFETYETGSLVIKNIPAIEATKRAISSGSENISIAEQNHSDLVPGRYEGGLKIWECTRDLADFLTLKTDVDWNNKTVLDLGCGAGLLGLVALVQGAKVTFHDYNPEVLELLTGPNVLLNVSDVSAERVGFYSGDWREFLKHFSVERPGETFDYILSSETIYNPANNEKIHDVFVNLLAPTGVCFLAGKSIYFGVGGSMRGFLDYINKKGKLNAETCWSKSEGISREIFKITHRQT